MTEELPPCPECAAALTYEMPPLLVCPMCAHEWSGSPVEVPEDPFIRDAVGNPLVDGDSVMVVKELKVKGGSGSIKPGTKVRNIRLIDGVGDHDIGCRVDGFGQMQLKSSVVKKI